MTLLIESVIMYLHINLASTKEWNKRRCFCRRATRLPLVPAAGLFGK